MPLPQINCCPSTLAEGCATYSPEALKELFDGKAISHILSIEHPAEIEISEESSSNNVGRLSLSGAQPKYALVIDDEIGLRYSTPQEQSTYILKPRPVGYQIINHDFCAANEHVTMQMAAQVYGIKTAANALCFFPDGEMAYITRRFDVNGDRKYAQEDFASLMGLTKANGGSDYKYCNGSYEECGDIIKRYVKSSIIDLLRFFDVVLFNFITLNDDAHLKNFTLLSDGKEYHLSPAYDLINTTLQIREPRIFALDKGLFREGMHLSDVRTVNRLDFAELGRRLGLPSRLVEKEIDRFSARNEMADSLINRSFLSPELKHHYLLSFHYRQFMLGHE